MQNEAKPEKGPAKVKTKIRKTTGAQLASLLLLLIGLFLLVASAFASLTTFALMGISLIFWGIFLHYVRPSRYVKIELLTSFQSPLETLNRVIEKTKHEGKGVYLPPKSLEDINASIVFVPNKPITRLPQLGEVSEDRLLSNDAQGLYLTPPGLSLCQLFEKTMGTKFTLISLGSLRETVWKLFTKDLEIAEDLNMTMENEAITVQMEGSVFADLCRETAKLEKIHNSVGCPLCSAVACALAKTTGKAITIENEEQGAHGKTATRYKMLEEQE